MWNKETETEKGGFIPNRQNITVAIRDCPTFRDFLSEIIDMKTSQFVPILLETYPFFQNYIDSIRHTPAWKETVKQELSDELLTTFFQNAYDSIKASPETLSYYEKVLCHTDAYCRFAASKVWEEELDYRCNLLKELLSKHSGQTQLEGLSNLLRTLDMYIAIYSKPPAPEEKTDNCLLEIFQSLWQIREEGQKGKSATGFLCEQPFSGFDYTELTQEPLSEQDAVCLAKFDDHSLVSLKFINYMDRNKKRFSKELRDKAVKIARKIYLTSQASAVESSPFWEVYRDTKHYLHADSPLSSDGDLVQTTQVYLSHYYLNIWTNGTLPSYSPNIDRTSTVSEVALDGLAKEAVEYFVRNNTKDISHFREVNAHITTFFYQYCNILSDGYIPYVQQDNYKHSLLSHLNQLVKEMATYIGGTFEEDFFAQYQDLSQVADARIGFSWSSSLIKLFSNVTKSLGIPDNAAITENAVVQDLGYVIALIHDPDFVYPPWRQSGVNPTLFHTPILDYISFIFKMYYDLLDASKEVVEAFQLYCSYTKEHPKQKA